MPDEATDTDTPKLTYGQKAVGIKFNPSTGEAHDEVATLKQQYADIIDYHNNKIGELAAAGNAHSEAVRLHKLAISGLQYEQMMSVKAATWKD